MMVILTLEPINAPLDITEVGNQSVKFCSFDKTQLLELLMIIYAVQ